MNLRSCMSILSLAVLVGACGETPVGAATTKPGADTSVQDTADTSTGKADVAVVDAAPVADGGVDCCKSKGAECGLVKGCPASCGTCPSIKECGKTAPNVNKCIDKKVEVKGKKLGETCGANDTCTFPKLQAEVQAYLQCVGEQCDSGICDYGGNLFGAGVCSKSCTIFDSKNNVTGAGQADGVDDGDNVDCEGAAAGPAGDAFKCVQLTGNTGGNIVSRCAAGTTFKPCKANTDCPTNEVCGFRALLGKYGTYCATALKSPDLKPGAKGSETCNAVPAAGPLVSCENNRCAGGVCESFCKSNADCATTVGACAGGKCAGTGATCAADADCSSFECKKGVKLFTDLDDTFDVCRAKGCAAGKSCADEKFYCGTAYNGVDEPDGDPDPTDPTKATYPAIEGKCKRKTPGGAKAGEVCDPYPANAAKGAPKCSETQFCVSGICTKGTCAKDADCGADAKCSTQAEFINLTVKDTEPKYAQPLYNLCVPMAEATTQCTDYTACPAGKSCRWWTHMTSVPPPADVTGAVATEVFTGSGLCAKDYAKGLGTGDLCNSDAGDGSCNSGLCFDFFDFKSDAGVALNIGHCLPMCDDQADCAKPGLSLKNTKEGKNWLAGCTSFLMDYTPNDVLDPRGRVYAPACRPFNDGTSMADCSSTKKCKEAKEACSPLFIATGPDKPAKMQLLCTPVVGGTTDMPTKKPGESCSIGQNAKEECASGLCLQETATTGYCSALCNTDGDCGNGTVCDAKHEWVPRFNKANSGISPTCIKKKSCTVCQGDWNCHSDYRCTKTDGVVGGRCAPPCSKDSDCGSTDGGAKCEDAKDSKGKVVVGSKVCTPSCK